MGAQDIAAIPTPAGTNLYILTNDGTGALRLKHTYALQQPSSGMAAADLIGNGNLDLIVAGSDPNTREWGYSVLLGNGDGSFQPPVFYPQGVEGCGCFIVVADFNNDHKLDLAIAVGGNSDSLAVLLGNGDGTFAAPTYYFVSGTAELAVADFNRDGNTDLAASSGAGIAILLGNGDGTFQNVTFSGTTSGPLLAEDLNRDDKADLISGLGVFLGNGDGTFQPINPGLAGATGVDALADFNGDGSLDAASQSTYHIRTGYGVNLGNGDGTFGYFIGVVGPGSYADVSRASFLAVADMNGDGKPDLIFEDYLSLFVLLNTTTPGPGTRFSPTTVTFPAQSVGTSSNPVPVTLTNTGTAALTVTGVSFTGANASEFSQTNNCTTLQPTKACTIQVTFSPTTAGNAAASLAVTDNAFGSPQSVPVSGTAFDFSIGVAPGSSDSATINPGQQANFHLEVAPLSGFSGTVNLNCSITPTVTPAPTCSLPASVQVTGGKSVPVQVTVGTTGAMAAGIIGWPDFPQQSVWLAFGICFFTFGIAFVPRQKLLTVLGAPLVILLMVSAVACGGSSSSAHPAGGTPSGTYTATVTAASGSLKHSTTLTVIVQ